MLNIILLLPVYVHTLRFIYSLLIKARRPFILVKGKMDLFSLVLRRLKGCCHQITVSVCTATLGSSVGKKSGVREYSEMINTSRLVYSLPGHRPLLLSLWKLNWILNSWYQNLHLCPLLCTGSLCCLPEGVLRNF